MDCTIREKARERSRGVGQPAVTRTKRSAMMPMVGLLFVCCGPGAHVLMPAPVNKLPADSLSTTDEPSRVYAGLLPWLNGWDDASSDMSGMAKLVKDASVPIVQWLEGCTTSGASRAERVRGEYGRDTSTASASASTSDFRLSTFDDLMTGGGLLFASTRGHLPSALALLLLGSFVRPGVAVCIHCKDTIPGCTGGDNCPAFKDWAANADIFKDKKLGSTPRITHALTPELLVQFTRPITEAIVGLACAPAVGTEIDFDEVAYRSSQSVVQAAAYGHCSVAEAASVLSTRMEAATEAVAISKIKGALDSLKLVSDTVVSSATGTYMFIWTKISTVIAKRNDGVTRIELNSDKSKAQALTATMVRPASESKYLEMLHYFIMVVVGLAIAGYMTVGKFVDDVAWGAMRMGETWQVSFELVCVYLRELDSDTTRKLNLGTIFKRGGQDTYLTEARRNSEAFFRTRGGEPRAGGPSDEDKEKKLKPNGRFNKEATKCCPDFNMGRPCKSLTADGTCKFNHRCNQFVSDKGKNGVCFGDHARCNGCKYDESKKLSKPATE